MNYDLQAYLQREYNGVLSPAINTKSICPGMYVLEAKGLTDVGKPKNIVTESYADGNILKSYIPNGTITHEATDVTLKLCFFDEGGTDRYAQYDAFITYMHDSLVWYWDNVRKRRMKLLLTEKVSPTENFKGQLVYLEAEVKFKNVLGYSIQMSRYTYEWVTPYCVQSNGLNTGYARNSVVNILLEGDTISRYSILSAFGPSYPAITAAAFASLASSEYNERLSALYNYIVGDLYYVGYVDFPGDVSDITDGAVIYDTTLCPIE